MNQGAPPPGRIIVEFVRRGAYLRCSAIDEASGIEVSVVGPATESSNLERLAIAKLRRRLTGA